MSLVKFLSDLNRASNAFEDSMENASDGLKKATPTDIVLALNAFLTALTPGLEGYQRQVSELALPAGVPEAAELREAELAAVKYAQGIVQELRAAIQSGSQQALQAALQKLSALDTDPAVNKGYELQKALLLKYNIPDAEVGFRRKP